MKNKSFKVIEFGFPKLGTLLDFGFFYNAYVIGYEKQMSIVDLLFFNESKMCLKKMEYIELLYGIRRNNIKFMDRFDDFKLVNRVNEMEDGKFYLTRNGFTYILEGKNSALEVFNNTATVFDYCEINKVKEKYFYEIVDKQLIVDTLSSIVNFRINSFAFFNMKEKISNYVKEYTFTQLVEKSRENNLIIVIFHIITATLIKLIDKIAGNEENFKEFH